MHLLRCSGLVTGISPLEAMSTISSCTDWGFRATVPRATKVHPSPRVARQPQARQVWAPRDEHRRPIVVPPTPAPSAHQVPTLATVPHKKRPARSLAICLCVLDCRNKPIPQRAHVFNILEAISKPPAAAPLRSLEHATCPASLQVIWNPTSV